jgi:NAD(P)H-nitrite reductase large subunit
MSTHFVIIGNGAAGYRAAKALRHADADARVSIITQESYPFYLRRQLADFVAENLTLSELVFQSRNTYRRERIDLFLETRVERILPAEHEALFSSGQRVRYDRLLVATGTRAVVPEIPGTDLDGVVTFDTLLQAVETKRLLESARHVAILGEGIVGLTLAESLAGRGIEVNQLIPGDRFWPEMLDPHTSALLEALLEENHITLRRGTSAKAVVGAAGRAIGVDVGGGTTLPAELVAVGCRRTPAVDLVEGAGLEIGRGIQVSQSLQTSAADIFAAGDVAEPMEMNEYAGSEAVFSWQRAWAHGAAAAAGMLGQPVEPVLEAMRLRTTIFGVDLAVLGRGHLAAGGDISVLELPEEAGAFRRLVFDEGRLVGAIVFGTGETVHDLNRLVSAGATRGEVEAALDLAPPGSEPDMVDETFARHCPICAAELVVRRRTRVGSLIACQVCNTDLVVCWDGRRGWLDLWRP